MHTLTRKNLKPSLITITGEFLRIFRSFEDGEPDTDSYSRTVIGTMKPKEWPVGLDPTFNGELTVKGRDDDCMLVPGMPYKFVGKWTDYRGQKQFTWDAYIQSEPLSRIGTVTYLRKYCPGVGNTIASRMWDIYGPDATMILRTDPVRVANEIKGLKLVDAKESACALTILQRDEEVRIELYTLFDGRGFTAQMIEKCIEKYGALAATRIKRDPFCLLVDRMPSAGFARCDALYQSLGLSPTKLKRAMLYAWYMIDKDTNGHTWFSRQQVFVMMRQNVGGMSQTRLEKAIKLGIRSGWLIEHVDESGKTWITKDEYGRQEKMLAEFVVDKLSNTEKTLWPDVADIEGISDHQREQLALATSSRFGLLLGTPGTGKTYTTALLIKAICDKHGSDNVQIMAPTGKAAVRLSENIQKHSVSIDVTTVHSALQIGRNGHDGNGWGFRKNEVDKLTASYIFVDEVSMLDCDVAACLASAITLNAHVLFIGDPYQLTSVGHGAVLRDLIDAGVPRGLLTEIRRNSGRIVEVCRDIKDGKAYVPCRRIRIDKGENIYHFNTRTEIESRDVIRRILKTAPNGINPVWDVQVIVGVNETGDLSRCEMNIYLQRILNPNGEAIEGCKFRMHDKVIRVSQNTYMPIFDPHALCPKCMLPTHGDGHCRDTRCKALVPHEESKVANGEIGKVVASNPGKWIAVEIDSPKRTVRVDFQTSKKGDGSISHFDLGYAITCHKAQGSQAPVIIVPTDDRANMVATREWHYTAFSRATVLCLTVGKIGTVNKQIKRVGLRDRKTFLSEQVKQLLLVAKNNECEVV
jgi:exodeoxyribonuclease V alpha subunit